MRIHNYQLTVSNNKNTITKNTITGLFLFTGTIMLLSCSAGCLLASDNYTSLIKLFSNILNMNSKTSFFTVWSKIKVSLLVDFEKKQKKKKKTLRLQGDVHQQEEFRANKSVMVSSFDVTPNQKKILVDAKDQEKQHQKGVSRKHLFWTKEGRNLIPDWQGSAMFIIYLELIGQV